MHPTARNAAISAILLVAAGLRLWGLDRNPLWNDELFSWHIGSLPTFAAVVADGVGPDVHPPGYFLLLHLVIRFIGDSEALLRLPSALAGVAAVWVVYLVGKKLYTEKEGLIAAALLAVSWPGVYHAQNARPYALVLLAVIAAFYFWIDILRTLDAEQRPRLPSTAGYVLAGITASYLHYFGLQIIALQGACLAAVFIARPKALLTIAVVYSVIVLAYVPWLPAMLAQMTDHPSFWIKKPELFSAASWQVFAAFHLPVWLSLPLVVPALALGTTIALKRRLSSDAIVIGWCALPFLAAYLQSIVATPVLTSRNLTVILPAIYLLVARGICIPKRRLAVAWGAVLIVMTGYQLRPYFAEIQNQRFDLASAFIVQESSDPAPVISLTEQGPFFNYYFRKLGSPMRTSLLSADESSINGLDAFWLLAGPEPPTTDLLARLDANYALIKSAEYYGSSARLYRRLPPVGAANRLVP